MRQWTVGTFCGSGKLGRSQWTEGWTMLSCLYFHWEKCAAQDTHTNTHTLRQSFWTSVLGAGSCQMFPWRVFFSSLLFICVGWAVCLFSLQSEETDLNRVVWSPIYSTCVYDATRPKKQELCVCDFQHELYAELKVCVWAKHVLAGFITIGSSCEFRV